MLFQMRFRTLFTLLLSLIAPAGSASADMRFNFENCYNMVVPRQQASCKEPTAWFAIVFPTLNLAACPNFSSQCSDIYFCEHHKSMPG